VHPAPLLIKMIAAPNDGWPMEIEATVATLTPVNIGKIQRPWHAVFGK
jgi:hypothetical protein